jgi:DNA invertase Pin-like site-specific DNA recombinase
MRLPRALDELRGLRAARWVRESTRGQYDTFGPEAQREQQDVAIERYGLEDTGLSWSVAHSGRTVGGTGQFRDMLSRAGIEYDVLVVGYVSRFARDLRTAVNARHELHSAGAAILFADERLLTSDEDSWELFAREAVEAEAYSRRLGKRIREGYSAKFRRLGDQAGNPAWGFRRTNGRLEPDPLSIGAVIRAYERFAVGNVTMGQIAREFGVGIERVRKAFRNPIYNGWAQRHRGRECVPAPWRANPPVSDELWERVQDVRTQRSHGGCQPGKWRRGIDPLGGLLYCACGARIRTNGTAGHPPRRQRIHPAKGCESWKRPLTTWGATHDDPISAQIAGVQLDPATIELVVRAVTANEPPAPLAIDVARIERRKRNLALDHAAGRIDDEAYLERMAELRKAVPQRDTRPAVAADQAVGFLRDLARLWNSAVSDEARAELVHAVYERIVVTREGFVGVTLTRHAYRHGLALALPETVRLQKRPRQDSNLRPAA